MKKNLLNECKSELQRLFEEHHVVGLKTGTEVEDMGFDEIAFLKDIAGTIPVTVKIGGPEARNDIRQCLKIGIDLILAPMVETVYALTNFIKAIESITEETAIKTPKLAINIESKTAVRNLDEMLHSKAAAKLYQITIGRSDLSKSMHLAVDDAEVLNAARQAIKKINRYGIITSIGGGVTVENVAHLAKDMPMNKLNTRHIVFSNNKAFQLNPGKHFYQGMMFERSLYHALMSEFPERKIFYEKRENVLKVRMGNLTLINKKVGNL
jgi:hypothetical protein